MPPRIYDCFLFNTEADILELRLSEHYRAVDYFVLTEATRRHSGEPKALVYYTNRDRYSEYSDKIIPITIEDVPLEVPTRWERENHHRDAIARGLATAGEDDIVLLSDVDEIVLPDALTRVRTLFADGSTDLAFFRQKTYVYHLNTRYLPEPFWFGSVACRRSLLRQMGSMQALRDAVTRMRDLYTQDTYSMPRRRALRRAAHRIWARLTGLYPRASDFGGTSLTPELFRKARPVVIDPGGWHFTWPNDVAAVQEKLRSFAHSELDTPEINNAEWIAKCIANGHAVVGRTKPSLQLEPLDGSFPQALRSNPQKYAHRLRTV